MNRTFSCYLECLFFVNFSYAMPLGSALGLLLFFYMVPLDQIIHQQIIHFHCYADDTLLHVQILQFNISQQLSSEASYNYMMINLK